jgi:transcriptional regulator with XRE-family HTH domain
MNSDQILKKIGTRIKEIRELKGISQQDLASNCNFESGRTNFTISTLYKISQALEITISELVDVEK